MSEAGSMKVLVCGCGPTLRMLASRSVAGYFVIGTNRSFQRVEPDVILTAGTKPLPTRRDVIRPWAATPEWATKTSGGFAFWFASLLQPDEVYSIGFGGRGHFDGSSAGDAGAYRRHISLVRDRTGLDDVREWE